ncbi:hypothetical protein TUBRATIS_27190 [Tubulinosema ratisbonensis]|uniref:Uncharacterized protein n=1 Tax=Tubulinosema ratisbonensis TaxID=291195 RepID=A0A437AIE7_9MICR|nr:hypothetical protein TUBRATIS_27190 [Tubulinosema ratisbonensis]
MHATYIELELPINKIPTRFHIYENEESVFIYVGQSAAEVALYNDILADKLKKSEPFRSKKSTFLCKLTDSKDINVIVTVLKEMIMGENLEIIKNRIINEKQNKET